MFYVLPKYTEVHSHSHNRTTNTAAADAITKFTPTQIEPTVHRTAVNIAVP